jgi:hemolysin type calcium-binding protein
MSLASAPASRRLGRLAAGLSATVVAAAGMVLTAAPAHAQAAVDVRVLAFGELRIIGSNSNDAIVVSGVGPVFVSNSLGSLQAGPGCVPDGSRLRCDGVKTIHASAMFGDDSVRNSTPLASTLSGGGGNDRLTGGFGNDYLSGGVGGADVVDGRSGTDTCFGETESNCEK